MRVQKSIYIERPAADVFWFLADPSNDRRWRSELLGIEFVGEVRQGVGTHTRQRISYQGRIVEVSIEVSEFVPGERICYKGHGGVRAHGCLAVRGEGDGSRVSVTGTAELKGPAAMMERYISQAVDRVAEEDLRRLRDVLETPSRVSG